MSDSTFLPRTSSFMQQVLPEDTLRDSMARLQLPTPALPIQNGPQVKFPELFTILTNSYEGRDKVTKIFQFLAKYLAWHYSKQRDVDQVNRYRALSDQFRDARSVFRLTKSLFEIKRIKLIQSKTHDMFAKVLNVLSRSLYFVFWLLDNTYILMKLINAKDPRTRDFFRLLSRRFQLIGQLLYMIYCIKTLRRTYTDESDLKVVALNRMTVKQFQENISIIIAKRKDYTWNLVRIFCDFGICLNENDLPRMIFGIGMNEGVEGLFGVVSALLYLSSLAKMKT